MSDELNPERPGSLAELGFTPHATTPLDEEEGQEEEAQAATAVEAEPPEIEAPPPEEPQEAQAQPDDQEGAEPVEAATEESILQSILSQERKPESDESELTRLRQEKARLEGLLEGRLHALEEQIRSKAPTEGKVAEQDEDDLLSSVPVRQVLQHLREEDPEQYEAALVRVAEEQAIRKFEKRFKTLEGRLSQKEQQEQQEQMATRYQQGISRVLSDIEGQGGLEAELVQQLRANPQESYLGQKFKSNPVILMSEEGIRGAVMTVAAQLRQKYESQRSKGQAVSPSVEASAGGGSPSRRGVSLGEKPKQISPEEQIIEDMMSAGGRTKALGFL